MKLSAIFWAFVAFLAFSAFLIYLPSDFGASLTIPPDSSEYAISLTNLFDHGRFGFTLNGEWYPSRYAPWFSLTCLSPAYFLSGGNSLCYHWAILVFSLAVLFFVCGYCRRLGLGNWSFVAPVLLMFLPDFVFYSRVVMTEIPYTALFFAASLFFVSYSTEGVKSLKWCLGVGILLAWLGMVRFTGLPMVGVFIMLAFIKRTSLKRWFLESLAFGIPSAVYLLVNAAYNYRVFGSPFRNGYHYWLSVPCDFNELTFSFANILPNVRGLLSEPIMQITSVFVLVASVFMVLLLIKRFGGVSGHRMFVASYVFGMVQLLVLLGLYLGYYWSDTRFYFSVTIFSFVLCLYSVYHFLSRCTRWYTVPVYVLLLMFCAMVFLNSPSRYLYMTVGRPLWLAEVGVACEVLPEKSVVMQNGDPNIMDHFGFRNKGLTLLPISRDRFDYVKYMVAPKSIKGLVPCPKDPEEHIVPGLVAAGVCRLPFEFSALDNPEHIRAILDRGQRLFYQKEEGFLDNRLPALQANLAGIGAKMVPFGVWKVPATRPNPFRHWYDELLFPGFAMDYRFEFGVEYYEIVLASD